MIRIEHTCPHPQWRTAARISITAAAAARRCEQGGLTVGGKASSLARVIRIVSLGLLSWRR